MSSAIGASSAAAFGDEVAVDDMIGKKGNPADYKANPTNDGCPDCRIAPRRRISDTFRRVFAEVRAWTRAWFVRGAPAARHMPMRFDVVRNPMYNRVFSPAWCEGKMNSE
ncbi:hypothetical protein [Caballeronia hypogeia]|uniref:hypothetical protein n=1 Tax=Caballeronia hypogeia TaxID=1777140 RepID=UPI0018DF055C|nr:hypothetical protein [Caballeronia hypogeia]